MQARYADDDLHQGPEDPPQQRARLFRRGHRAARRQADGAAAERDLHPSPDAGGAGPLHHVRTRRDRSQDRQRRRPRARAGTGNLRAALRDGARRQRRSARRRACVRHARRRDRAGEARGRRQLRAARGRRLARLRHRGRPASGGRTGAEARRPAVHRQCLRSLAGAGAEVRPDLADHRPEHGGQIDLPAPERADRAAGADRQLRAGGAGADRHRRPAVLARRRGRRSGARPLHLHGGDGGDRRHPQPGQRALAGHPRRNRPRHRDLRRAVDRLGGDRASA